MLCLSLIGTPAPFYPCYSFLLCTALFSVLVSRESFINMKTFFTYFLNLLLFRTFLDRLTLFIYVIRCTCITIINTHNGCLYCGRWKMHRFTDPHHFSFFSLVLGWSVLFCRLVFFFSSSNTLIWDTWVKCWAMFYHQIPFLLKKWRSPYFVYNSWIVVIFSHCL